jgi:hypothetical protein
MSFSHTYDGQPHEMKNAVFLDVELCTTWHNIPEDGILYSHHNENLKSASWKTKDVGRVTNIGLLWRGN